MTFWGSVTELRQIEYIALLITMIVPIVSGTILFTVRHRIKTIQTLSNQNQAASFRDNVHDLAMNKHQLIQELSTARKEVAALRRLTAPRQIDERQETILLERLRGVQASPVIVSAYAFEEESQSYAA